MTDGGSSSGGGAVVKEVHIALCDNQRTTATFLPADPKSALYLGEEHGTAGTFKKGMDKDGGGAPFPLRHEIVAKEAAWVDVSLAGTAGTEWYFDFGASTIARTLEYESDSDWKKPSPRAAEIRGEGQWKNDARAFTPDLSVPKGQGKWEVWLPPKKPKRPQGKWAPLTSNDKVLKQIEEDYCGRKAQLNLSHAYRLDGGLATAKEKVLKDGSKELYSSKYKESHMYYVDFAQTISPTSSEFACAGLPAGEYFRQVDLWYTLDRHRERAVRRVDSSNAPPPPRPPTLIEVVKASPLDAAKAKKLIEGGADLKARCPDDKGYLLIHHLIYNHDAPDLVEAMIATVADLLNTPDADFRWTPLLYAARFNRPKTARRLLELGADSTRKDKQQSSAVVLAEHEDCGNSSGLAKLIKGAAPSLRPTRTTSLHSH